MSTPTTYANRRRKEATTTLGLVKLVLAKDRQRAHRGDSELDEYSAAEIVRWLRYLVNRLERAESALAGGEK